METPTIETQEPTFTITIEQLKENGWVVEDCFPYLAAKDLTADPEDKVRLIVHAFYNDQTFALLLSDGTMVNIGPYTMEQLNLFERMILSVEFSC